MNIKINSFKKKKGGKKLDKKQSLKQAAYNVFSNSLVEVATILSWSFF